MATGGASWTEDRRQTLTCSLCLEIFSQPKALPCLHTFCLKCLQDLTAHLATPTFPCPNCRSQTTIPSGGVSSFPTNFHIQASDLALAQEGTHCLTHTDQRLDLFCSDCELLVCLKCVLTKHRQHETQDVGEVAAVARQQLEQDEKRLLKAVSSMTQAVEAEQKEQQSLQGKKEAVKTAIRKKHATAVALVNRCRDDLLRAVDAECKPAEAEVCKNLEVGTNHILELCELQKLVQDTLASDTPSSLLTLAKEMKAGKGSARVIHTMTSSCDRATLTRPVLNSTHPLDTLVSNVRAFFGAVETVQLKATPAEVVVEERFLCKKEPDTEVFSLCPVDDGTVRISYASCGLQSDAASDIFQETGQKKGSSKKVFGKGSYKSRGEGNSMFLKQPTVGVSTHTKNGPHNRYHLSLRNSLQGKANVKKETVTSEKPFATEAVTEFSINIGAHRAFDVDKTKEELFVVVEEPKPPETVRKVRVYKKNQPNPLTTYIPPSKPFNPVDVCFYKLGGKEVLIIVDELGDSVHVVEVQAGGGALTFLRHLAPGSPLLLQPTAINTDHRGRLWLACRGGSIITMTPTAS